MYEINLEMFEFLLFLNFLLLFPHDHIFCLLSAIALNLFTNPQYSNFYL